MANVVRTRSGGQVDGLLYQLPYGDLMTLDVCEGCPVAYRRRVATVTDALGRGRRAQLYLQYQEHLESWLPSAAYLRLLRRAYKRLGFDLGALVAAAAAPR